MSDAYTLWDGEERNREHPDTFEIPTRLERETLKPGDWAKLGFDFGPNEIVERMWVMVKSTDGMGGYMGRLDNEPLTDAIRCGATVVFGPEHVLSILPDDGSNG